MANITKVKKKEIFDELTELVESGQIMGVTQKQLSIKFGVKRETIARHLKKVYAVIPDEDIQHTKVKIKVMFDRLFREAQKMLITAQDNREKAEAMKLLLVMMDKFTDFLERFGIKEKVADKIDIEADITSKQLQIQIIDDRRQIENENPDNKSI